MSVKYILDAPSRRKLIALSLLALLCCVVAGWAASRMIDAQREGERLAHVLHRLESLRAAILSNAIPAVAAPDDEANVPRLLADCLQLSSDDAAQQRRLTKLGALLDMRQRQPPINLDQDPQAGPMQPGELGNTYVLLAAHAWIDAMKVSLEDRLALSQARHQESLQWVQWAVAAALIAALLFGLVLIRVMRHLSHQGHARISSLEAKANRDPLTGLPNRRLLQDRLEQAVLRARRRRCHAAVVVIDLDGFKPVNDTHGHAIGDVVLRRVSKRMKSALRSEDTVCRMGGDEFVVIIGEVDDPVYAVRRARDLVLRISRPIRHEDKVLRVGASAGLALFPDDAGDGTELLELADQALYAAKHGGRGQVVTAGEMTHGHTTLTSLPSEPAARLA